MIVKCVNCGIELERAKCARKKAKCFLCKKLVRAESTKRQMIKLKKISKINKE